MSFMKQRQEGGPPRHQRSLMGHLNTGSMSAWSSRCLSLLSGQLPHAHLWMWEPIFLGAVCLCASRAPAWMHFRKGLTRPDGVFRGNVGAPLPLSQELGGLRRQLCLAPSSSCQQPPQLPRATACPPGPASCTPCNLASRALHPSGSCVSTVLSFRLFCCYMWAPSSHCEALC